MQYQPLFPVSDDADKARLEQLRAMAEGIERVLDLSVILAQSGRRVDMAGLDRRLGLLCAQALDLPPEFGRQLIYPLRSQIAKLDQLIALSKSRHF